MGPLVFHPIREEVQDRLQDLLDALVMEEFALQTLAVREDRIAPLVHRLVRVEVRGQENLLDPAALPELVARKLRGLCQEMMDLADGGPIRDVVSPIGPQSAFDDVVSILRRLPADNAFPAVSLEDGIPELVST